MVLNTRKSRIHTDSIDRKRDVHYSPFCQHLGQQKESWGPLIFTDWDTLYHYLEGRRGIFYSLFPSSF